MQKLLSIVIPVYKVEPYINKCLDSLLLYKQNEKGEQVLNDDLMSLMDILIVNDGTPDNSAELSREYEKKYPQYFRQIDKENGGHGSVWNMGVALAAGKYLKFLDSDDWLSNLDRFLVELKKVDADLVITNTNDYCENNEVWQMQILDMDFYKEYDANTFDWLGNRTHNYLLHHACCYKTEVFRQFLPGLFLEKQPYDDVVLWPAAMIGAKSIEAFDFPLYNYLMDRPGQSISKEVQMRNLDAYVKTHKHTIEFYEHHPVEKGTTKDLFIRTKLPKAYNSGYRRFVNLSYKERKARLQDWDNWVRQLNPSMQTLWIKLYRHLPYWLYVIVCKGLESISHIKKKLKSHNAPTTYKAVVR